MSSSETYLSEDGIDKRFSPQTKGVTTLDIQAFKPDGKLYRHWDGARLLEDNDRHYLVVFLKTRVLESNGKS